MQRFFTTFPSGAPGVGLLILRLVIGVTAGLHGTVFLARTTELRATELLGSILVVACGLSLAAGFLTPLSGVVVTLQGVVTALSHAPAAQPWSFVAIAIACLLLGPGAYSVDARLFGRREILIGASGRTSKGVRKKPPLS